MDHKQARIYITEGFVNDFGRVPTRPEAQVAQGIGYLESRYGTAWLGAGTGSKNWGCVQRSRPPCDPAVSFLYTDSHPNADGTSTAYSICFKKYKTDGDGATDLIKVALGTSDHPKSALDAAAKGDIYGVSAAMRKAGYYEGFGKTQTDRINNHFKALSNAIRAQCLALGEPYPDGKPTLATQVGKVVGSILPAPTPRTLRRGLRGDDVKAWQMAMNQSTVGKHLATDGMFGPETELNTKLWQSAHNLKPDGIVGPKTRTAAYAVLKAT